MQSPNECTRAAVTLSVAFLLMFTSYNGIESLQTSIIPGECHGCTEGTLTGICQAGNVCQAKVKFACDDACESPFTECHSTLGNTILGVVYLAFTLSAFFGPVVPNYLGMKRSLFGASFTFALFALANLVVAWTPNSQGSHPGIMLTAGVLLGLSASVLWIAQASYLTELSVIYATFKAEPVISSMGYFNGIFFAIHNASGITGNLISSLVLDLFQWHKTSLFLIYTALGLLGTAMFLRLPELSRQQVSTLAERGQPNGPVPVFSVAMLWTISKDSRVLILLPMFLFGGVMRGFTMGEFTSNFIRESLGSASIGYIMTVFGTVNVLGSYGFGKLTDRFGPHLGISIGYASLMVAYFMCFTFEVAKCDNQWFLVLSIAVLLGVGDSMVVGQEFSSDAVNAFSLVKAYQSGATAASFFFFKYMSFNARVALLMGMVVTAAFTFVVYYRKFRRVSSEVYLAFDNQT
ncbi:hypothetical protein H257_06635 [Aphanomyces astaci]|uniref:Major facilitator superfamily (MFS) profile domain-containing protein n=1 Tax=Aphanomyces astaci TaxID=112090 RepID=W4GKW5_APHAT|nr:hypothetical protein H257_06635 [Aphanomyces astaci]ETV80317.1 hypothetical protein H257_06635 [Aphanomyces astaci]|eukprot:XP_009830241.1 hypothetical protein H257_06635 [Aphanomyces astaci]